MKRLHFFPVLFLALWLTPNAAMANNYCKHLDGAHVYAQDEKKTFLGIVHQHSRPNSIFNKDSPFGSEQSPTSIWNKNGLFGNEFSEYSAFNPSATLPPIMIKGDEFIGHISRNLHNLNTITPKHLPVFCKLFLR